MTNQNSQRKRLYVLDSDEVRFSVVHISLKEAKKVLWADSTMVSGQPSLKLRDHHQFIPDLAAKCWEDMRYAGHWFWLPVDIAIKTFPTLKKANINSNEKYDFAVNDFGHNEYENSYKAFASDNTVYKDMICIYCIRYYKWDDLKNKRVAEMFYAPYVLPDEPLLHRFMQIPFDSLPYRNLSFTKCNDRLLPIPALEPLMK